MCRAVGNEGVSYLQMSQMDIHADQRDDLLAGALARLNERVVSANSLIERLANEAPQSRLASLTRSWKTIGMDRLSQYHVLVGQFDEAVSAAEESQTSQTTNDPTIIAHSKFYYGNALWHAGRAEDAIRAWSAPTAHCSSPIALCKEPSSENVEFLKLMAKAGVDFGSYDEQGFSALEYAVLSNSSDGTAMVPVILDAIRNLERIRILSEKTSTLTLKEVDSRLDAILWRHSRQAELRRQFRILLQDYIRPLFRDRESFSFGELRKLFARFMAQNSDQRRVLSPFYCVKYTDFKAHGQLPVSDSGLAREQSTRPHGASISQDRDEAFVVFISYRWLGNGKPDDNNNTQWNRMVSSLEQFLDRNPYVEPDHLHVWLDYACVDQRDKSEQENGVNALPLAVLLSDAMISLVDDRYYTRAWCGVEVKLVQTIVNVYGLHQWWEHMLDSPATDIVHGTLQRSQKNEPPDISTMKLTKEEEDRPKIEFLMRQAKLLGKSDI